MKNLKMSQNITIGIMLIVALHGSAVFYIQ